MEQDIESRTISFKVQEPTPMRKKLIGAFFLSLGISIERMGIKSKKKVRFRGPPQRKMVHLAVQLDLTVRAGDANFARS